MLLFTNPAPWSSKSAWKGLLNMFARSELELRTNKLSPDFSQTVKFFQQHLGSGNEVLKHSFSGEQKNKWEDSINRCLKRGLHKSHMHKPSCYSFENIRLLCCPSLSLASLALSLSLSVSLCLCLFVPLSLSLCCVPLRFGWTFHVSILRLEPPNLCSWIQEVGDKIQDSVDTRFTAGLPFPLPEIPESTASRGLGKYGQKFPKFSLGFL